MTTTREQMLERLSEIRQRRLDAFREADHAGASAADNIQAIADATTIEDINTLHEAREVLDDFERNVLDMYVDVWREFGKYRCPVCGMTDRQSAAVGYDCLKGC
ncbi:hypothetical protein GCM10009700_27840 [Brevibacterium sanguinis]|uniref:hypothetical protein n=1 Tax=Brevibacterium sanguinis TaxID=232444 RepID=UPI0031DB8F67